MNPVRNSSGALFLTEQRDEGIGKERSAFENRRAKQKIC